MTITYFTNRLVAKLVDTKQYSAPMMTAGNFIKNYQTEIQEMIKAYNSQDIDTLSKLKENLKTVLSNEEVRGESGQKLPNDNQIYVNFIDEVFNS